MNENAEQVKETTPETFIDYKAELEKAKEIIEQLKKELMLERHHILPEHYEFISATLKKLVDENINEEKAFEIIEKVYPEAFKPKLPEFSVHTTGISVPKEKSSFLAGLTGKIPL
ncbi:MAG: hypothetical protein K2K02_04575 [Ruminococcus sp.]|nr:hypothetical protein [Ruminococcus sp.]MDE6678296.1 hypothetical protein [Ruminococcus sp.]